MNYSEFFERDLKKLSEEISSFKNEEDIWEIKPGISNSAGNLTLHLVGNLNHFIGAGLGKTGYIRNRENEFSLKNILQEKLIEDIDEIREIIKNTLPTLTQDDYKKEFPLLKNAERVTIKYMLLHLLTHLNYHLGQINYLRRIIELN
ncbi:MAG: DinB family protein [Ginsengibacter sp.]|jgi:uncharacterized damage-inducible protein DinB